MEQFELVTVGKTANVYFDGQVTSRTVTFKDGSRKTLGIMQPGEYEFSTALAEVMEITQGQLEVLLPEQTQWQAISAGELFEIGANQSFKVKVHTITDYCCSYFE